jgi:hypothetical protein
MKTLLLSIYLISLTGCAGFSQPEDPGDKVLKHDIALTREFNRLSEAIAGAQNDVAKKQTKLQTKMLAEEKTCEATALKDEPRALQRGGDQIIHCLVVPKPAFAPGPPASPVPQALPTKAK